MSEDRWLRVSEGWIRLLSRLYPADFREELGGSVVEAYRDRCRGAYSRGGVVGLGGVWSRALVDSVWNGVGERLRPGVAWRRGGNWGRDAELVMRRLVRAPVFTLTVVVTLTVGLGAFAVVYAVVDRVLIERPAYDEPDDLYFVWRSYPWLSSGRAWLRGPDIVDLAAAGGVIDGAVGMRAEPYTLSDGRAVGSEEVTVMETSPGLFELLGVAPTLGRGFRPDEAGPGRPPVVVLGHDLWMRRFGGDSAVVGAEIRLDGRPYTVIGVTGRSFRFVAHSAEGPPIGADAYITFDYDLAGTSPYAGWYSGLIRARAGTSPEAVAAAVGAVGAVVDARNLYGGHRGLRLYPVGLAEDLVAPVRPALQTLGLAAVFLVLVLVVNLAMLLLGRAMRRERELAVSRALGANGRALARASLFEGGVLGLLGGAGAVLLALWGTRLLVAIAPVDLPRRETIAVDGSVVLVVLGLGVSLGILAGMVPALWATRTGIASLLGHANVRGGGGRGRMRRGLVVVQLALSLVLLSAGGLVVRSFQKVLEIDPGFEPAGVLTLRIPVPTTRYADRDAVASLHDRIDRAFAAIPGVAHVGATTTLPLSAAADGTQAFFPGAPGNTGDEEHDEPRVDLVIVRPGAFDAVGTRILSGRGFGRTGPPGAREAVIDRTLSRAFFPDGDAVGATLVLLGDSLTVIGVVEHARLYDIHRDGRPQVYIRNEGQFTRATVSWMLRTRRPPLRLAPEVRAAIRRIDPELALAEIRSMEQVVDESLRQQRLSAVLIAGFALGALLLAAMGLFGVVSGSVTRRRHELAVRVALGGEHRRVLWLVVGEGARLVGLGVLAGIPGVYLSARVVGRVLVGVSPFDPVTLGAVAVGLGLVALAACYLPARRVLGIEPARLLRQE